MNKKVCIITRQGVAARPPRVFADKLVAEGNAHYTSKSKYKAVLKREAKRAIRKAIAGL